MNYRLAIDIGASSGRHILGCLNNGILTIEEVYRFENNLKKEGNSLIWDTEKLFSHILEGLKECKKRGTIPETVAIDTWGVDYVLLDEEEKIISPVYCYRDSRTEEAVNQVHNMIDPKELYRIAGIQKQPFNTIYQLYCDKQSGKLEQAKHFLMMPAYFSYRLCGVMANEYTNLTTTGLMNAKRCEVDSTIMDALGIDSNLFGTMMDPGTVLGEFTNAIKQEVGFSSTVMFCPSHDTAAAVAACPQKEHDIYISSGTWSLIGTELLAPMLTEEAQNANFTNEGGIEHRFRFLKNYMGMWLLQNIRKNLNKSLTYDEMMHLAEECDTYSYIDVNAKEFLAPDSMIEAIKDYLKKPDISLGEVLNSVYHSLAKSYRDAVEEVEKVTGTKTDTIHIVGGGCQDQYLNRLTAIYTKKKVTAGPVETTALGNIITQYYAPEQGYTLAKLREIVANSFAIETVQ